MAFIPHNRLTLIGDRIIASEPSETWSININMGGDLSNTAASPDHNDDLETILTTYGWAGANGIRTLNTNKVRLLGFKWNAIGADGKYVNPAEPNTHIFASPVTGSGVAGPSKVPQTAMVASLYTDLSGRRYRGRIYWPTDVVGLFDDWSVNTGSGGEVEKVRDRTKELLQQLNTWGEGFETGSPGAVIVASSKGVNTPVSSVRVGNYLDTQRRRRAQFTETYLSVAL